MSDAVARYHALVARDERAAVEQAEWLHDEFVPEHGLSLHGRHHEIYLGDVRRTAAERLRTILRQPVQRS